MNGKIPYRLRNWEIIEHIVDETSSEKEISTGFFDLKQIKPSTFLGKWSMIGDNKRFDVQLTVVENLSFNPLNYKIKAIMQDAVYKYDTLTLKTSKLNALKFYSSNNKLIQEIDNINQYMKMPNMVKLKFQDFNFDGYLDFQIEIYIPNLKDFGILYFTYDSNLKQFFQDKNLQKLGNNIWFDAFNKEVQNIREATKIDYYKWDKNGLIYLRTEDYLYD